MNDHRSDSDEIKRELAQLTTHARNYTVTDLKSGAWFIKLLRHALQTYSKTVDAGYFARKYPSVNRDAIIDRRIDLAQRYAALAGGLSASGYSAAVVVTLGSAGGASPLTLPAAVTSFAADLFFVSRLQLRLAYDLSVLYGHAVDLDDPEDLIALIKVAFGIKAGEELQNAAAKLAPEAVRQGIKRVVTGPALQALQALPVVGRYLLQRNIIKMAIPGVAIPLSTVLNYYMTGRIAKVARQIFRTKAIISEAAPKIVRGVPDELFLFLQVVWLVVKSDGKTTAEELWLVNALAKEVGARDGGAEILSSFRLMVDSEEANILERLAHSSLEVKQSIYEAACFAAVIDHKFHRNEKEQLQRIASVCRIEHDSSKVTALLERYAV